MKMNTMTLSCYPVRSSQQKIDFLNLPWSLYAGNPYWVPPLKKSVSDLLDQKKNVFFKHAQSEAFVVYRGQRCVGRIVVVNDKHHNQFHHEKVAFFGFFESIEDPSVVHLLLEESQRWAQSQGMKILRGPVNLSTNYECGLLVDGFEDAPTVMMNYHPPYYALLLESWGLKKVKDLFAYDIHETQSRFSERLIAQSERMKSNHQITVRALQMRHFDQEIALILDIYNDAWEKNWGFVPMQPDEFRQMASDLKLVLDPRLCLVVEVRGQPAGFSLALPDVNQALRYLPDGRLWPIGLLKLLWYLKGPMRKKVIRRCRILTLGIKKAYRELAIGPLLYTEYLKIGPALGYPVGEASWILEDNRPMNQALRLMGAQKTKVYRIYEKAINDENFGS